MAKQTTSNTAPVGSRDQASVATRAGQTRKKAGSKVAPAVAPATLSEPERALSHQQIAAHAYSLYLARGARAGGEVADWLRAEHELRTRSC